MYNRVDVCFQPSSALQMSYKNSDELNAVLDVERSTHEDMQRRHSSTTSDLQLKLDLELGRTLELQSLLKREQQKVLDLEARLKDNEVIGVGKLERQQRTYDQFQFNVDHLQVRQKQS